MGVSRTLLVGGVSATHDALLAAALRGHGLDAEPIGTPDGRALATGRLLLARAHCNPTYYLAGALVERLRKKLAQGQTRSEVIARYAHLTVGSCGPCRFATYAAEHRRALDGAGLAGVPVVVIDQLQPQRSEALAAIGVALDGRLLASLARAVIAADVLVAAGCAARARTTHADTVDNLIDNARAAIERAFAERQSVATICARLGQDLARATDTTPRTPLRVRLIGELFAANTEGHGGYRLVRWLEARGAIVEPPRVSEWLSYLAWQVRRDVERRLGFFAPDGGPRGLLGRDGPLLARHARAAERSLAIVYRRWSRAAGLTTPLADMDDLATLARPHYHTDLRAGMGHLEVGAFLAAERDRSADLVVSVKPFGCLPSSALSDGVLAVLARRARHVGFVSVETTGDADALVESRLELALERARDHQSTQRRSMAASAPESA